MQNNSIVNENMVGCHGNDLVQTSDMETRSIIFHIYITKRQIKSINNFVSNASFKRLFLADKPAGPILPELRKFIKMEIRHKFLKSIYCICIGIEEDPFWSVFHIFKP